MFDLLLLSAASLAPQGTSTAPVVINEFVYNDSGTDDREFVELYNRSGTAVDISNWVLDSEAANGPLMAYTIPGGTSLAPGGYYVFGSSVTVANVNLDLATGGPNGNGTDLWGLNNNGATPVNNAKASLTLRDGNAAIVDTLVWNTAAGGLWDTSLAEGDGFGGDYFSPNANLLSLSRVFDGFDNDLNGRDFYQIPATPGTTNGLAGSNFPFVDNFDARMIDDPITEFAESFQPGKVIDPAVLTGLNPRARPQSPQGGNASMWHDQAGGGNSNYLLANAFTMNDVVFEAFVYFESPFDITLPGAVTADSEYWMIGVRGTTDESAHPHDVPGRYYQRTRFYEPGGAGLAWAYYRTIDYATLYLVDFNDGGLDFNILGSVDIVQGSNDDWQRLRLHAQGDRIIANFGGTYGCDDGIRFSARTSSVEPGGLYLAYREFVADNTLWSPLTIDALEIRSPTTLLSFVGTGSATTVGTPQIDADGLAITGSTGFAVLGSSLVPNSLTGAVFGFGFNNPPIQIPGAPAGATLIVNQLASSLGLADGNGEASFGLPIPCNPSLAGLGLNSQLVNIDAGLGTAIPVGTSQGMATTVGN